MNKSLIIAVPVYNEEEVIFNFVEKVLKVFDSLEKFTPFLLFINDGSTDGTLNLLKEFSTSNSEIGFLNLSRNFGHQAALSAAFSYANSDVVITMDCDLQDPPEMIVDLLENYLKGFDVVYTYRTSRKGSILKRAAYYCFYRILDKLSSIPVRLDSGDFALYSRRVVSELRLMKESHPYYRGLRTWVGYQQIGLPMVRPEREAGKSKYSFFKLCKLGLDGIFSFSLIPLRLATLIGAYAILSSFSFGLYGLYAYLTSSLVPTGFTATILIIIFTSGVQLVLLGVVGEYVGRIYESSKNRPVFIVEDKSEKNWF